MWRPTTTPNGLQVSEEIQKTIRDGAHCGCRGQGELETPAEGATGRQGAYVSHSLEVWPGMEEAGAEEGGGCKREGMMTVVHCRHSTGPVAEARCRTEEVRINARLVGFCGTRWQVRLQAVTASGTLNRVTTRAEGWSRCRRVRLLGPSWPERMSTDNDNDVH